MAIIRPLILTGMTFVLTTSMASAGWREDIGVFRIGVVARPGAGAVVEGAEPIKQAYSNALGMPVDIYVARDYADLIDAQTSGRIEYAIHTSLSYATAALQCACVTPLVAPLSDDGTSGIRSALISTANGPRDRDELGGHRIAFGPDDSTSAAMLPIAGFRSGGQALRGNEDFLVRAASETQALQMVVDGKADAIFGFMPSIKDERPSTGGTLNKLADAGVENPSVLWTSDFIRHGPHAVRMSLPQEARQALINFLTGLRDNDSQVYDYVERRFGGGFAIAKPDEYLAAIALARSVAARDE